MPSSGADPSPNGAFVSLNVSELLDDGTWGPISPPSVPAVEKPSPQVIPDGLMLDGRYRLMQLLGEGGIGAVYRGEHILMRKPVAVKILKREAAAERDVVMRFVREAQVSSRLANPHCVTVHDFGQMPDRSLYLVMELIDGESLRAKLIRDERLSLLTAYEITAQLLEALGAAHDIGVTHRDVKPENIMLVSDPDGDGRPFLKLLDFGIARPIEPVSVGVTKAGFTVGTPGYIAPEQALGRAVDGRADLYAAAVILYEMLCGQRPFQGRSPMEVINNQLSSPLVPPSKLSPPVRLPGAFEDALLRGLSKDPAKRYPDARAFREALARTLPGDAPVLPPPAPSSVSDDDLLHAAGVRRTTAALLGGLVGLAFGASAMILFYPREEAGQAAPARPTLSASAASEAEKREQAGDLSGARASLYALPGPERFSPEAQARIAVLAARAGDWDEARAAIRAARAVGAVPSLSRQALLAEIALAPRASEVAAQRVIVELGAEIQDDLVKMLGAEDPLLRGLAVRAIASLREPGLDRAALLGRALEAAECPEQRALLSAVAAARDLDAVAPLQAFGRTPKGLDACVKPNVEAALQILTALPKNTGSR